MALRSIKCPLCPTLNHQLSISEYTKHLRLFHASNPDFKITCGINGCQRVYTNLGTFKNHLYGIHNVDGIDSTTVNVPESETSCCSNAYPTDDIQTADLMNNEDDSENPTGGPEVVCNNYMCCSSDTMQKSSALFLLGLKEKHKLTQVTVQSIVDNVTTLTHQRISSLKSQACILSSHKV